MNNTKLTLSAIGLIIICSLRFENSAAQELPTLAEFLDELTKIGPVTEVLSYDTVPDFDFETFRGLTSHSQKTVRYVVGSTGDKKIRTITPIRGKNVVGTMTLYEFGSFKILTFKKTEVILNEYPDFPIFCVSKDSRFIVYLNRPFQYQQRYKARDVASIQILRPDLFPMYILNVRERYIRMISDVTYKKDDPKSIDGVRVIVVFQAEKDKNLLISGDNTFSEECYIPKADFIANFHPTVQHEDVPHWIYSNDLPYE